MSLIGQTIGNYKVTRLLGEGGMGAVYLGEHPVIGRRVAIKVLHIALSRDTEIVARFFNEARAIHTIGDEHIVEILDFGQTPDGQPYFVMEFLGGESMNDRVARGPLSASEVAQVADQICRALSAAHAKGIVHRDLKPHNVQLIGSSGGRLNIKLLDFGVAKIANSGMGDGSQSVKTRTGSLMGTPLYMSPEQCRGSGKIDHRTDIYSLGVMLFEMLAGRTPFIAEGAGELFAKHMLEAPPQLAPLAPHTPRVMAAAIMRSLAKNADDRFATMDEFRGALLGEIAFAPVETPSPAARTMSGGKPRAGGTLAFPSHTSSTTLSSTSSEIDDGRRPAKGGGKGRAGIAVAVTAVAAAGVLAFVLVGQKHKEPAAAPKAAEAETPRAAETVTIRFDAEPLGTHLFRLTDDKDLGAVPVQLKLPKDGGHPDYVFRLAGYKDKAITADLGADRALRVTLEKEPPAPPPIPVADVAADTNQHAQKTSKSDKGPSSHKGPGSHHGHASAQGAGDEDGLATPSF